MYTVCVCTFPKFALYELSYEFLYIHSIQCPWPYNRHQMMKDSLLDNSLGQHANVYPLVLPLGHLKWTRASKCWQGNFFTKLSEREPFIISTVLLFNSYWQTEAPRFFGGIHFSFIGREWAEACSINAIQSSLTYTYTHPCLFIKSHIHNIHKS